MKNHYSSSLLIPISVGSIKLKNRLVALPMAVLHASADNKMPVQSVEYYRKKAEGGFGLIIMSGVSRAKDAIDSNREFVDMIHSYGTKIIGQIGHPGRQVGQKVVAPSPVPCVKNDVIPHELTIDEIHEYEQFFINSAEMIYKSGFDGVEIHGAHGYLIAEFMSTYANKRIDEYGGTLENRMRFPLNIYKGIREKCGYDFTISFRISADEFVPGGRTLEETKAIAVILEKAGVDLLSVSSAVYGSEEHYMSPMSYPTAYLADYSDEIKKVVNIPVLVADRIRDPKIAENLVISDKTDLVGMARASLADPELPKKFFEGKYNEIRPCIGCNQGCLENLNKWKPTACMVNPEIGFEYLNELQEAKEKRNVAIVGGGPAGMYAAITASKAGHNVTLYEKNCRLGGNFYLAAIPPTKGTMAEFTRWLVAEMERNNVTIKLNEEFTMDTFNATKPDSVIIASGSTPIVPNIPGITNENVYFANDVLEGKVCTGRKVVVCGGGLVGAEIATLLASNKRVDFNNRKVTVVEMKSAIAEDEEYTRRIGLLKFMEDLKINSLVNTTVKEIRENGVVVATENGDEFIECDSVVLAFGYKANNSIYDEIKDIVDVQIVGDASGVANCLKATREGYLAGCHVK